MRKRRLGVGELAPEAKVLVSMEEAAGLPFGGCAREHSSCTSKQRQKMA
jgi:hypothetical protein